MLARPCVRTVAIALLLPLTAAFSIAAVQPAQAGPAPVVVKTLLTDVDGDKTYDTVQVIDLGSDQYRLTVTTTKAVTSSIDFTSQLGTGVEAGKVWYGASTLDGVKGSELVVRLYAPDPELGSASESADLGVYTWRSGALVAEKAPSATQVKGVWHIGDLGFRTQGYRFFTSHGRRYVDVSGLTGKDNPERWVGKITRSVWKKGAWVKVSTRKVSLTRSKAQPYLRFSGSPMLLGVARADIDGDGVADELRYYRMRDAQSVTSKVKVTTARHKVVTRTITSQELGDPFLGAAEVGGVAGQELVFRTYDEDPVWRVLTWRSGKLVDAPPPPKVERGSGGIWIGCGDTRGTSLTFSVVNGERQVIVACFLDDPVLGEFTKSVWRSGAWVKLAQWSQVDPPAHSAGFHGLDFIKP